MNLKLKAFVLVGAIVLPSALQAKDYLISPEASTSGAVIVYKGSNYIVGDDAFASIDDLMSANPEESSTVYFTPGSFAGGVINVKGLKLLGCNADSDPRKVDRPEISEITAEIKVEADNVTINGFNLTGDATVSNVTATSETPINGFKYIFNVSTGSTLKRDSKLAVVKLGNIVSDAAATTLESQGKFKNVNISHNIFKGSQTANYVAIAGGNETITVYDNNFDQGSTSIRLDNCAGVIKLKYNNFYQVGVPTEADGGGFCMGLNRCALSGTTKFEITHNYFDECIGQSSHYSLIRFFPGEVDAVGTVTPVNCTVEMKYNVFRNKRQIHATHNEVYYANKNSAKTVMHDVRFNDCDNNNYEFANFQNIGDESQRNYYNDNFDLIDVGNCTFGTYKAAYTTKAVTIIQNFDVDPVTGDVYYIQIEGNTAQSTLKNTYGDPKGLCLTRFDKSANSASKMQLVWAGHGTNMSVARIDGKVYIFTGGRGTLKADGSETRSDACCWFPWVSGAVVDLRKTSFTYGGKTYPIYTLDNEGINNEYPAVDEVSRLFVSRYTPSGKNSYAIYDLDEVIANPSTAKALKVVSIKKGDNPTSTSGDNGYNTWDHQGYAISGDYLYVLEGVSKVNSTALNGKPTLVLHVYNWRTEKFVYRKFLKNSTLQGYSMGEPEGVSVRRNSNGHAEILIGVAIGETGARQAVIHKYTLNNDKPGLSWTDATVTPSSESLTFTTSNNETVSQVIETINENLHGGVMVAISGENAKNFSAKTSSTRCWNTKSKITVTYTPTEGQSEAKAMLRISSPTAEDKIVVLEGINDNTVGIEGVNSEKTQKVITGDNSVTVEGATSISLFSTTGALAVSAEGDRVNANGLCGLYIARAVMPSGEIITAKVLLR